MDIDYNSLVEELKESPLFPMSLGSMELFHSNVWRWLMGKNKKYIKAFFEDFPEINENDKIEIKREYKHTDICLKYNNKYYIIENKIKSMLLKEQLEKYDKSFEQNKNEFFEQGKYVFPFEIEGSKINLDKWKPQYYDAVLNNISEITEKIEKIGEMKELSILIIKEYVKMTKALIELIKKCVEGKYKNNFIIYNKNDKIYKKLEELRIHDIVRKINCELLRTQLDERIKLEFHEKKEKIIIETGFSNGKAQLSARWKIFYTDDENDGYFLLGPQLEDNAFRTMIHICSEYFGIKAKANDNDKKRSAIYNAIKEKIFDDYENQFYKSYRTNQKEFNKYEGIHDGKDYIALYKYKKVGITNDAKINPNFDNLCDEFIKELHKFEDYETEKHELINMICESVKA